MRPGRLELPVNRFFDANATTPLSRAAREAWLSASWHNPSSLYREAAGAKEQLEDCRDRLADILHCASSDLIFLSGATEANNAVMGHFARRDRVVAVSAIEHPSVRVPAFGGPVIPAGASGVVEPDVVRAAIRITRPSLVSLMAANNETGALQPWREVLEICREEQVQFHCDAAQWLGKLPAAGLGACDFLTGSAHKFGGPKGVGFLKVTGAFQWLRGGPQEERRRAGTENLPGIAGMLAALEEAEAALAAGATSCEGRDAFEAAITSAIPGTVVVSRESDRLGNTSLLILPSFPNVKWLARLNRLGFQVSTGSACSSGGGASEVLAAMGFPEDALRRVIRVSGLHGAGTADWLALAEAFADVSRSMASGHDGTAH